MTYKLISQPLEILKIVDHRPMKYTEIVRRTRYAPQTVRKVLNSLTELGLLTETTKTKYKYYEITERGEQALVAVELLERIERGENLEKIHLHLGTP